ncbi:MAG: hypothetical protein M4D80_24275 [Myxococcota bacterium]|nr:hypothetical protein [Myxococcota bacterium]
MQVAEHVTREEQRLGAVAPVLALREVASHATAMRVRFDAIVAGYDLQTCRSGIGPTLSSLRGLVTDRVVDPERAYRSCLLDLRHGIDVVKLAREVARNEELFGVIRWCDDWLRARRTLVARVEAQLVWFMEEAAVALTALSDVSEPIAQPAPDGTQIAAPVLRHEQEEASPEHRLGVHPSRTT